LCWFTIWFKNQLKHTCLTHQTRHTCKKSCFNRLTQKGFIGTDFHNTKLGLNKVTKVGPLHLRLVKCLIPEHRLRKYPCMQRHSPRFRYDGCLPHFPSLPALSVDGSWMRHKFLQRWNFDFSSCEFFFFLQICLISMFVSEWVSIYVIFVNKLSNKMYGYFKKGN
jgi:hypothetical protein